MSARWNLERAIDDVEEELRDEIETEWQDKFDELRDKQKHALDTLAWIDLPEYPVSDYHRGLINEAIQHILLYHELPTREIVS